uniref:Exosome complex component RRP40 n=1 Tax=Triatoma dimidiata TaxID=72491 RepID=A0A0V0G9I4_TRIDM
MNKEAKVGEIVFPGQVVKEEAIKNANTKNKVILGPGLKKRAADIIVSKCGILQKKTNNLFWVNCFQKRYMPVRDETVVGVVAKKTGDYFKVDIGSCDQAMLYYLSFEGATKKYRPDVNVGDVIFGRLLVSSPDMEPEIVCINSNGKKGNLGVQALGGFLFSVSLNLARKILNPDCLLLSSLGKVFRYESAIGMNGNIWIKSEDITTTIAIANAILKSETMSIPEIKQFSSQLLRSS